MTEVFLQDLKIVVILNNAGLVLLIGRKMKDKSPNFIMVLMRVEEVSNAQHVPHTHETNFTVWKLI